MIFLILSLHYISFDKFYEEAVFIHLTVFTQNTGQPKFKSILNVTYFEVTLHSLYSRDPLHLPFAYQS